MISLIRTASVKMTMSNNCCSVLTVSFTKICD